MSERTGPDADHRTAEPRRESTVGRTAQPPEILRLTPHITPAEAVAVFGRKLPEAAAEATEALHPFWWVALDVETHGPLHRGTGASRANVLVDAATGKASIADFAPRGHSVDSARWPGPATPDDAVVQSARALVRTKAIRTFRLGMSVRVRQAGPVRGVLKLNWLVRGANHQHAATILVDGLDGSHYVVRVEKA